MDRILKSQRVTCNFAEFWVYDMEQPNGEPQKILLKDLEKEYYRLQFLVDEGNEHLKREMEVSVKAGNLVGIIYDKLLEQYGADDPETLRSLNILCVRLVFCLYAEDAGLFNSRTAFHDYLNANPPQKLRRALVDLSLRYWIHPLPSAINIWRTIWQPSLTSMAVCSRIRR